MSKYAIWNKTDLVYTPVGEVLTPEEWIQRYGWIGNPSAVPVVASGIINGAFSGELSQMRDIYERAGVDFSMCTTNEEILAAIEDYEDAQNAFSAEPSVDERIAAALEYQVLASLPDETV